MISDAAASRQIEDPASEPDELSSPLVSYIALVVLGIMVLLPVIEAIGRRFAIMPGGAAWVQHLTLWVGMYGAVLASFRNRHLAVAAGAVLWSDKSKLRFDLVSRAGTIGILTCLAYASSILVYYQISSPEAIADFFPIWLAQMAMPAGFILMAVGTFLRSREGWKSRTTILLLAVLAGPVLALLPPGGGAVPGAIGLLLIVSLAAAGMPLYAVLGGAGLLLFFVSDVTIAAVPAETYRIVTQPVLPSIPMFALAGVVLAKGGAPGRLLRLVQAWTGWLPGGASIATVLGCAFFTAITGASGVTILALGGLLIPILLAAKYDEKFSLGLLTASGSVGLLFPPSLPVILYGVYGQVAINRLFLAALLPGMLLVGMLSVYSILRGRGGIVGRGRFDLKEVVSATWGAKGDLLLPVVIVVALFGGLMTVVEVAALAAVLAILLECIFHRNLRFRRGLMEAMVETTVLIGALLAVLGLALGLVSFLVDAQVPYKVADWVTSTIHSKWVFLLVLNVILLFVGATMDIYSAIVVIVPLIVPTARYFGVDLAHLGIIFLTNLELGYLTPPIGMNLFLSSLRFDRPLLEIWRSVIPFLVIFVIWVLLVTYVPWLSVGFANLILG